MDQDSDRGRVPLPPMSGGFADEVPQAWAEEDPKSEELGWSSLTDVFRNTAPQNLRFDE